MSSFLNWSYSVLTGFSTAWGFLMTPCIKLGDVQITPLYLMTFSGITAFLLIAVIKWAVS